MAAIKLPNRCSIDFRSHEVSWEALCTSYRNYPGRAAEIIVDWSRATMGQGVGDTIRGHSDTGRRRGRA